MGFKTCSNAFLARVVTSVPYTVGGEPACGLLFGCPKVEPLDRAARVSSGGVTVLGGGPADFIGGVGHVLHP